MSNFWKNRKIYVSIITAGYDWEKQIDEINELKLTEVALFLTGADKNTRKDLYKKLENSIIKSIPFVHLRTDMKLDELKYLIEKFGTKKFNVHPERDYKFDYNYSKYKDFIYVENLNFYSEELSFFKKKDMKNFAGVCIDTNHFERVRYLNKDYYKRDLQTLKKYKIGFNHISPLKQEEVENYLRKGKIVFSHALKDLKELDYLKYLPMWIFSDDIALEMTNSIKEQLKAREYIVDLLKDKK